MGLLQDVSRKLIPIEFLFLVLLAFSFTYLEPGSEGFVVAVLTLIPVTLTLLGSIVVIYIGWSPLE